MTTDLRAALRDAANALARIGLRRDAELIASLRAIADAPPTVAELLPMVDATHEVRWTDADGDEWRAVEADVDGGPRIAIEMRGSDQAGVWWFGHYPLASDLAAPARPSRRGVAVTPPTAPERCPTCDRPVATKAHWAERDSRGGRSGIAVRGAMRDIEKRDGVCMVTGWIHGCAKHAAPWRARAIAAEALVASYESPTCDHRHPCRCGSGGHPRRCMRHPKAFDAHCAELNVIAQEQNKLEEAQAAAAQWAKVAPLIERLRVATQADDDDPGDVNHALAALLAATEATP